MGQTAFSNSNANPEMYLNNTNIRSNYVGKNSIIKDKFYLMTVIPMKNTSANMSKNRMYDEFIDLIKTYYENDPDIYNLDCNKLIKEIGAKTDTIGR